MYLTACPNWKAPQGRRDRAERPVFPIRPSALVRVWETPWASPEVEVLECEVGFYDASGFDPGSEDILLGGLVVGGPDPIQAVQVAGEGNTRGPGTSRPSPGQRPLGADRGSNGGPAPHHPLPRGCGQRVGRAYVLPSHPQRASSSDQGLLAQGQGRCF